MASKTAPVAATLLPAVLQPAPDTPDLPAPPACFSPCRDPRSARVPPRAHHRHLRPRQALQVQEGLQGRLQAAQVVAWQVVGMARRASGGHGQAGKRVASTSATMSTSPITVCASQGVRRLPVHRTCANTVCCVQLIRFSRGGRCACVGVASEGRLLCSVGAALASGSGGFRSSGTMCSEWVPEQWYYVFRGFRSSKRSQP